MPGDPKECRLHAMRCAELAANTRNPQLKSSLLEISANWQKLARDLEATQALMSAMSGEGGPWLFASADESGGWRH